MARLSKHIMLIAALLDAVVRGADKEAASRFGAAFEVLCDAQRRDPQSTAELLAHPQIGVWAAYCTRQLYARPGNASVDRQDLAHFSGVAMAAAMRARIDCTLRLPVRDGYVMIPTMGRVAASPREAWLASATSRAGELAIGDRPVHATAADGGPDRPGDWEPVRRLRTTHRGITLEVDLDDVDPYRHQHGRGPAPRLDPPDVAIWADLTDRAWGLLVESDPAHARELSAGLRSMIPLVTTNPSRGISSTSQDGFGAFALTPPDSAMTLALAFVHEFQHSKLSGLLDLVPLHDRNTSDRYYAPWRDDPRPIGGLLQGSYAFLGIADFWRRLMRSSATVNVAQIHLASTRRQVGEVLDTLMTSGHLTIAGIRFVDTMRASLLRITAEPVSDVVEAEAAQAGRRHRLAWRMRNTKADPDDVRRLAERWPSRQLVTVPVNGNTVDHYRARIRERPADLEAWAGLLLEVAPATTSLPNRPELLYPVYAMLRDRFGRTPEPDALVRWFVTAV
jgi:HEXXH motif-containing protein